jgi:cyclopropane fatty-acyl-phospholipid synthase-like methyltransferase
MGRDDSEILSEAADYYTKKITEHGATPKGVDWNGEESQTVRFDQLSKIFQPAGSISINDLGCGYGALVDYLIKRDFSFSYTGIDVSSAMTEAARKRLSLPSVRFVTGTKPESEADYGIASGIFNVRQGRPHEEWERYIENTLDAMDKTSKKGFAFNCLTSYSDKEKMREYLYYADPCYFFDRCKRKYSKQVALLHDYGLYEFTILVRR